MELTEARLIYVFSWIAVRADAAAVASTLGVQSPSACSIRDGLERTAADNRLVFVSPSIDGFVLAVARGLGRDEMQLASVSTAFGEAQAFYCDGKRESYGWGRSVAGKVVRAVGWNQGEIATDGEATAGEPTDLTDLAEMDVATVAANWSVAPGALLALPDDRTGLIGARAGTTAGRSVFGFRRRKS